MPMPAEKALTPLSQNGELKKEIFMGKWKGPFMLGTVGGVTDIHPTARLCLKILGFPKAVELAGLCCALGLIQNFRGFKSIGHRRSD